MEGGAQASWDFLSEIQIICRDDSAFIKNIIVLFWLAMVKRERIKKSHLTHYNTNIDIHRMLKNIQINDLQTSLMTHSLPTYNRSFLGKSICIGLCANLSGNLRTNKDPIHCYIEHNHNNRNKILQPALGVFFSKRIMFIYFGQRQLHFEAGEIERVQLHCNYPC